MVHGGLCADRRRPCYTSEVVGHAEIYGIGEDVGLQRCAAVDRDVIHEAVVALVFDESRPVLGELVAHAGLSLQRETAELIVEGDPGSARDFYVRHVDAGAEANIWRPLAARI